MEKEYKIVPFDVEKAKAGVKVVTKKDKCKVEILKYDLNNGRPIIAIVNYKDGTQGIHNFHLNGRCFCKSNL